MVEIRHLDADGQGRVTIGAEYANSTVTVAVAEGDQADNWDVISDTVMYLHTEVLTRFSRDLTAAIEESITGDVAVERGRVQSDSTFTITVTASPTTVTKQEMETINKQISAVLDSHNQPFEQQYTKLQVGGEAEGVTGLEQHQRILRYLIGPVEVATLPNGYFVDETNQTQSPSISESQ